MRVLIATDAWHPQVNGVVRTLTSLSRSALRLGVRIEFLTPDGFRTFPVPTYPGLRVALPSRRQIARETHQQADPDAVHIATEGPIGHMARGYCLRNQRPFTTSYTTRFPEYLSARVPIPEGWVYAALRRFHSAAAVTMVATPWLVGELDRQGASPISRCGHVGSIPTCSNLIAPLSSPLNDRSSSQWDELQSKRTWKHFFHWTCPAQSASSAQGLKSPCWTPFPQAKFLGLLENGALAAHVAAADVFVFQPDGHLRRSTTRSARERRSDCRIPGYWSEGCRRGRPSRGLE